MREFTWRDGERTVRFGRGAAARADELLGRGYLLLTTPRAARQAPAIAEAAGDVVHVGPGRVDELAAELLPAVERGPAATIVALGGGRVIDTAKAIAAATGRLVSAVPTTLSAAEMTWLHRHAAGLEPPPNHVRPRVVVNDPELSASQPEPELAASAANSLGHAVEAPATVGASPVPALAAAEAARLTAQAYAATAPDRDALALAALLSGYAIDATGYGLHHVLSQTLVREAGIGHGPANAAMLPHTMRALAQRGATLVAAHELAELLLARAGIAGLGALGVDDSALDRCADAAARRPQLANTPPAASREEIRALYAAAQAGV